MFERKDGRNRCLRTPHAKKFLQSPQWVPMECQFLPRRQEQVPREYQTRLRGRWPHCWYPVNMSGNGHEERVQRYKKQAEGKSNGEKAQTAALGHRADITEPEAVPAYKQHRQCKAAKTCKKSDRQQLQWTARPNGQRGSQCQGKSAGSEEEQHTTDRAPLAAPLGMHRAKLRTSGPLRLLGARLGLPFEHPQPRLQVLFADCVGNVTLRKATERLAVAAFLRPPADPIERSTPPGRTHQTRGDQIVFVPLVHQLF